MKEGKNLTAATEYVHPSQIIEIRGWTCFVKDKMPKTGIVKTEHVVANTPRIPK